MPTLGSALHYNRRAGPPDSGPPPKMHCVLTRHHHHLKANTHDVSRLQFHVDRLRDRGFARLGACLPRSSVRERPCCRCRSIRSASRSPYAVEGNRGGPWPIAQVAAGQIIDGRAALARRGASIERNRSAADRIAGRRRSGTISTAARHASEGDEGSPRCVTTSSSDKPDRITGLPDGWTPSRMRRPASQAVAPRRVSDSGESERALYRTNSTA